MKIELVKNKLLMYEYVSFDIFDTLVKRNVRNVPDVFYLVQVQFNNSKNAKIKLENFMEQRIEAEKLALKKLNKESVSLNEIYEFIKYDKDIKEELKEIEKSVEYEVIQKNNEIFELYDFCKKNNKKIIAISDMYFDGKFLNDILKKNDIIVHKCFSSSDYGVTKSSGNLFKSVLDNLKINPNQIVHIGNSFKSDYLQHKKMGIDSIRIVNKTYKEIENIYINDDEYEKIIFNSLDTYIKNNLTTNFYYNIGFGKFGCLLYGFCNWLYKNLSEKNIRKVYFLSRDGFIVKKAFEILYPNKELDIKYLYISRRAIRVPTLFLHSDFRDLKDNINMSNYFDLNTFIKRLGLKRSDVEKYITTRIEKEFSKDEFFKSNEVERFYKNIQKIVIEN